MNNHLWLIAALAFCAIGMAWLALSLKAHWQQVFAEHIQQAKPFVLRACGASCLFFSALCCLLADHPSIAVLVWVLMLGATAIMVSMALSYQPRVIYWLGKIFT